MSGENPAKGLALERDGDAPGGPGARLRQMRERRGLGQQEVAQRLHLKLEIVDAIERDDYAALSGATYIRGYLRNYAQLVGIPAEGVLEQFNGLVEEAGEPPPLRSPERVAIPPRMPAGALWGTIAFVAVAALMAWWLSRPPPSLPEPVIRTEPQVTPPPAPATTAPDADSALWASDLAPPEAPAEAPVPATVPELAPKVVEPPSRTPEPEAAPPADEGTALVLEFQQDSWTEVVDADGRRRVYSLQRAGTTRGIAGRPPYRIVLGNGAGVRVLYRGEQVASTPRIPGAVTRLTVGNP